MSFKQGFKVTDFSWNADKVISQVQDKRKRALRDAAEHLLGEANRTVPLDEGTLMRSGSTDVDDKEGSVYYDTPYAERVHEHPGYQFRRGRRGKWLQMTFQEEQGAVRNIIADRMKL